MNKNKEFDDLTVVYLNWPIEECIKRDPKHLINTHGQVIAFYWVIKRTLLFWKFLQPLEKTSSLWKRQFLLIRLIREICESKIIFPSNPCNLRNLRIKYSSFSFKLKKVKNVPHFLKTNGQDNQYPTKTSIEQ